MALVDADTVSGRFAPRRRGSWVFRFALVFCLGIVAALYAFTPVLRAALDDGTAHVLVSTGGADRDE